MAINIGKVEPGKISIGGAKPGKISLGEINPGTISGVGYAPGYTAYDDPNLVGTPGYAGTFTPTPASDPAADQARALAQAQAADQARALAQAQAAARAEEARLKAEREAKIQAEADQLIRGMGQFDTVRGNQDAQAQSDYDKAIAGFNDQDARDLGRYNEQVGQNEANLSRQRQQALLASAQGQRGLNAVLASLGALGGTGSVLANRAVAQSANQDLGNAQDTFSTNATNLTQSWQDAEQKQRQRQEDASAQLQALKQNNANTALTGKQNLFRDVANLFDQGSDQRTNYLRQAADLGSQIAETTRPVNSEFMKADPTFSPEALKNYLAGTSDMTVNTSAGGSGSNVPINSPLFASTDRRRERQLA